MASEFAEDRNLEHEEPMVADLVTPDANQTADVLWSFMQHRFMLDQVNDDSRLDVASPIVSEMFTAAPVREATSANVGRQLAQMGDVVDAVLGPKLTDLARSLHVTKNTAYEKFVRICRQLFADSVVNWGRIAVLMQFGYRMAIECMQQGIPEFLRQIVSYLVRFIFTEKVINTVKSIASWIAEQGGWVAAVNQGLGRLGASAAHLSLIIGLCITTLSAVALLKR